MCTFVPRQSLHMCMCTTDLWGAYNSFWSLGYFFTYLLFYERLRCTFANTQHALTTLVSSVFFLLLLLFIVSQQSVSVIWWIFVLDAIDLNTFNSVYTPALITKFTIDFVLNIYIVYLFCTKIYKITIDKTRRESAMSGRGRSHTSFKNEQSIKIFETMVKYFLLTIMTVSSTQIFTASQITLSAAINHAVKTDSYNFYRTTYIFHFILGCIDSMVSTVYVLLTFSVSETWYTKYCTWLHLKCVNIWGKLVLANEPLEIDVNTHSSFHEHQLSVRSKSSTTVPCT